VGEGPCAARPSQLRLVRCALKPAYLTPDGESAKIALAPPIVMLNSFQHPSCRKRGAARN